MQDAGYAIPSYPDAPSNEAEKNTKAAYDKIKGSAVNPVLREGNSDRRAPKPVKAYAAKNPHSMGAWSASSASHVSTMGSGDFASNEKSVTITKAGSVKIQLVNAKGTSILKEAVPVLEGEIIDDTYEKSITCLLEAQIADAKDKGFCSLSHESNHDEGFRPHHFWPCGTHLF